MSRHLSSLEISEWAAGTRTPESENHLHECAECRGELTRLQGVFSEFRDSLRYWSAAQGGSAPRPVWLTESPLGAHRLRWALVAVTMVLLAAIPFYRSRVQQHQVDTNLEDAVLLEQIDAGVSRSIPAPMEPLTGLVSWGSTGSTATGRQSQQKK
ncbi:MAG: hypothetical protein ABSH47_08645 [Bryobacteraceae bacterium]|jgi:hypothetical protein